MLIKMAASDLSKWLSFGQCRVRSITGFNNQAADCFIMLCEQQPTSAAAVAAGTVVANGVVPKMAGLDAPKGAEFKYEWAEGISFAQLCVAVSSTQTSVTLVAASAALDMTIDIDGMFCNVLFPTLTMVGDLTTSVTTLQVWADASGPFTLAEVAVKAVDGAVDHFTGYAVDAPATTSLAIVNIPTSGTVNTFTNNWGSGLSPLAKTTDQVTHQGLTIQPQTGGNAQANPGLHGCIRAIYF